MIATLLRDEWRLLTFRAPSAALRTHWRAFLAFGLACTWLAGMGRYWDNPRAEWWQLLGLGSVAYVFLLSGLIWILLLPMRPQAWSYRNVLLFVSLTAPPAMLYAIPVEKFLDADTARFTNAWFLGVVATWRVALLGVFLRRVARLSWLALLVGTLLPITLIVVALSSLNLEHVVFELMGGIEPHERSGNDMAYFVVLALSVISMLALPVLVILYIACIAMAWPRKQARQAAQAPDPLRGQTEGTDAPRSRLRGGTTGLLVIVAVLLLSCTAATLPPALHVAAEVRSAPPLDRYSPKLVRLVMLAHDDGFLERSGSASLVRAFGPLPHGSITSYVVRMQLRDRHMHVFGESMAYFVTELTLPRDALVSSMMSTAWLGQRDGVPVLGVEAAAAYYFGKDLDEITVAEAALIAAMLKSASYYSPLRHPGRTQERRDGLLRSLYAEGGLGEAQLQTALLEPLPTAPAAPGP